MKGVSGARFVKVSSRQEAEAILSGAGVRLAPGRYLFVDGNADGGLGVVSAVLRDVEAEPTVVAERGATVFDALAGQSLAGLATPEEIRDALGRLGNVLAEMAAAWVGLARMGPIGAVAEVARLVPAVRILREAVEVVHRTEIGDGDLEVSKQQSIIEEKAYRDTWGRGLESYLHMLSDHPACLPRMILGVALGIRRDFPAFLLQKKEQREQPKF